MSENKKKSENDNKTIRLKELVKTLNEAAKTYEQEDREIMSNFDYDRLYDELLALERETGIILSNSPTQRAGYEVLSELPKERHLSPMLSLDKTKDVLVLKEWIGNQTGRLSWKLDDKHIILNNIISIQNDTANMNNAICNSFV